MFQALSMYVPRNFVLLATQPTRDARHKMKLTCQPSWSSHWWVNYEMITDAIYSYKGSDLQIKNPLVQWFHGTTLKSKLLLNGK